MSQHNVGTELSRGTFAAADSAVTIPSSSSSATYVQTAGNLPLLKWGEGVPTGTADAVLYWNKAGTTTATTLYVNVNGTWTVLNIT